MDEQNNKRNGGAAGLVISCICLSVIVVLVWLGHGDTSTKLFDPSSFYYGIHSGEDVPSPLEMRNRMVIVKRGQEDKLTGKCNPAFRRKEDDLALMRDGLRGPMVASNYPNVSDFVSLSKEELGALFTRDGDSSGAWYCWPDSVTPTTANYIISPLSNFDFVDYSNEKAPDETYGIRIAIAPKGRDNRKLEFRNVVNWYCHLDTMTTYTEPHTSLVGKGDEDFKYGGNENDDAIILGLGNTATHMVYLKRDSADGEWYECPAADWYFE